MAIDTLPQKTELEQVALWRLEKLKEAGVRASIACTLACADADLHQMLDAKRAGATDDQLQRIFT